MDRRFWCECYRQGSGSHASYQRLATTRALRAHYTIFSGTQFQPNLIDDVGSQPEIGLDQNYSTPWYKKNLNKINHIKDLKNIDFP